MTAKEFFLRLAKDLGFKFAEEAPVEEEVIVEETPVEEAPVEEEVKSLEDRVSEIESRIDDLKAQFDEMYGFIKGLADEISKPEDEVREEVREEVIEEMSKTVPSAEPVHFESVKSSYVNPIREAYNKVKNSK